MNVERRIPSDRGGDAWRAASAAPAPRNVRPLGAGVGLAIGAGFAIAAQLAGIGDGFLVPGWTLGPAIVVAGATGGWLAAPQAWRARTWRAWLGTVALLAGLGVVIGDLTVAALVTAASEVGPWDGVALTAPLASFAAVVEIFLLGLVVVGWIATMFTTLAAAIWAIAMWRLRSALGAAVE